MGIDVRWDNLDGNTIRWDFIGRWTVDHIVNGLHTTERFLSQADEPVNFIVDVSEGGLIPPQLMDFIRKRHLSPHPMEGKKVVIGADRYLRVFWQELTHYLPEYWQVEFADTYEEARAIINTECYADPIARS